MPVPAAAVAGLSLLSVLALPPSLLPTPSSLPSSQGRGDEEETRPLGRRDFELVLAQFTPPSRAAQAAARRRSATTAAEAGGSGNGAGVVSDADVAVMTAALLRSLGLAAAEAS